MANETWVLVPSGETSQPQGLSVSQGGTGLTVLGNANELLGVKGDVSGLEYKALLGMAGEITVVHTAGQITLSLASAFMKDLVDDLTPQLGGNLDMNTKNIQGVTPVEMAYLSGVTAGIQAQLNAKQALDATLTSLALLGTAANKLAYTTGIDTWAETPLTAFGRSLIDDADAATAKITLGLIIGTNVQAWDAHLDIWAMRTAPSGTVVGTTDIQSLTNKRINLRVQSVADAATVTPSADNNDSVDITALAQAVTIAAPTGTPVNFQRLFIRFKDNGVARTITWNAAFVAGGVPLPTTTVAGKILTVGFLYNTANSLNKWQCIAKTQEA